MNGDKWDVNRFAPEGLSGCQLDLLFRSGWIGVLVGFQELHYTPPEK